MPTHDRYASFLLRLQSAQEDDHPTWLTSIQSTKTGELHWFPSLDAFIQFLQTEFGECEKVLESQAIPSELNSSESSSMIKE